MVAFVSNKRPVVRVRRGWGESRKATLKTVQNAFKQGISAVGYLTTNNMRAVDLCKDGRVVGFGFAPTIEEAFVDSWEDYLAGGKKSAAFELPLALAMINRVADARPSSGLDALVLNGFRIFLGANKYITDPNVISCGAEKNGVVYCGAVAGNSISGVLRAALKAIRSHF